jgi:hypothetical protein
MAIASDALDSGSGVVDALTISAATAIAVVAYIEEKKIRVRRHQAKREHRRLNWTEKKHQKPNRSFRNASHSI